MSHHSKLDIYMKSFEKSETERFLNPLEPIIIRIDGKAFHTFTKSLTKPFDKNLMECMQETTKYLCEQTNARLGYTQSDEISLYLKSPSISSQVFFNAKIHKILSVAASMATAKFNDMWFSKVSRTISQPALFDCRAFNLGCDPTKYFEWRQADCMKNSISMIASSMFSHKELHGKTTTDRAQMVRDKIGNAYFVDVYPLHGLYGTYFLKEQKEMPFSKDELENLPAKHKARTDPNFKVLRSFYTPMNTDYCPLDEEEELHD